MSPKTDDYYEEAHKEIDEAIEESIEPSPDGVHEIAKKLKNKYHVTLIHRRFLYKWKYDGGRWVRRSEDD
jgi:hypothetical protein